MIGALADVDGYDRGSINLARRLAPLRRGSSIPESMQVSGIEGASLSSINRVLTIQ